MWTESRMKDMTASTDNRVVLVGRDTLPGHISLGAGERLRMTIIVPEGVSCDADMTVDLDGPGAELDLAGAFRSSGDETLSLRINVRHNAPGCRSEQLFKSVVGGNAMTGLDALVYVAPGADRTVARQQMHSLLLSDTAVAVARPQLEIYADDVECSHGATSGYLNPDELFYMRSRGIPESEARSMQVEAFLSPVMNRVQ